MDRKGQVSAEFIIVVVLLLGLFLFSLAVFAEKNSGYIYSKERYEARLIADKLAGTINSVYLAGPGAETKVLLEKKPDLNVSLAGNAVVVEWRGSRLDSALLTEDTTAGSLTTGSWVNVKNVNGGIQIENA